VAAHGPRRNEPRVRPGAVNSSDGGKSFSSHPADSGDFSILPRSDRNDGGQSLGRPPGVDPWLGIPLRRSNHRAHTSCSANGWIAEAPLSPCGDRSVWHGSIVSGISSCRNIRRAGGEACSMGWGLVRHTTTEERRWEPALGPRAANKV